MATLTQLQSRIDKLQAQAQGLIAKRAAAVIAEIRTMMEKHGLTTADIDTHTLKKRGPKRNGTAPAGAAAKAKGLHVNGKLPPKYMNLETGATWSGHARPPVWIRDAKDRSVFLIDKPGVGAASRKSATAKKTVAKKASTAKPMATRKAAAKKVVTAKKSVMGKAVKPATTAARTKRGRVARKSAAA
jgi:DNA-binding protein H-NS